MDLRVSRSRWRALPWMAIFAAGAVVVSGALAAWLPQRPIEEVPTVPRAPWVYTIDEGDIERVRVTHQGEAVGFVRSEGRWHAEKDPQREVLQERWSGITLVLRGLRSMRSVPAPLDPDASYGFDPPVTLIEIGLRGDRVLAIEVGVTNPANTGDYLRVEGDPRLYLVDPSWRFVLARLASEPPFDP